jgi:hypothetical protein
MSKIPITFIIRELIGFVNIFLILVARELLQNWEQLVLRAGGAVCS